MTFNPSPPQASPFFLLGGSRGTEPTWIVGIIHYGGFTDPPPDYAPLLTVSPSHGLKASHPDPIRGLRLRFLAPSFPPPASPPPLLFLLLSGG